MNRTLSALLRAALLGPALLASDTPADGNRFGLSLALAQPQGAHSAPFGTGAQLGLLVHFNRESPYMGRLRIDYTAVDARHPVQDGYGFPTSGGPQPLMSDLRREGYGIAYEFLPHFGPTSREGAYLVLGIGGMLWNERLKPVGTSPLRGSHTDADFAFTPSLGAGYRFNPHVSLEARMVGAFLNVGPDPTDTHDWEASAERHFATLGLTLRF